MAPSAAAVLLILASSAPGTNTPATNPAVGNPVTDNRVDVRLMELAALRRLVNAMARQGATMTEGERAAAWSDFSLVSQAVVGDSRLGAFEFADLARAASGGGGPRVRALPGYAARDEAAYQLMALGYSARETADVISGRISQRALDTARQMMAIGQTRDLAANYLDTQYKRIVALRNPVVSPRRPRGVLASSFDALIEKYASLHQVESAVVRAIIETESAFNPSALSQRARSA